MCTTFRRSSFSSGEPARVQRLHRLESSLAGWNRLICGRTRRSAKRARAAGRRPDTNGTAPDSCSSRQTCSIQSASPPAVSRVLWVSRHLGSSPAAIDEAPSFEGSGGTGTPAAGPAVPRRHHTNEAWVCIAGPGNYSAQGCRIINPARIAVDRARKTQTPLEQVRRAGAFSRGRSDWHSRLGIRGARWNEPTAWARVFATVFGDFGSRASRHGEACAAAGLRGATRHRSSSVGVSFFRSGVCGGFEVGEHFGPCADDERGEQTDRASCREVASRRDDVTRRHGAPRAHRPAKMEPRACAPSQSDCRDLPPVASSDNMGRRSPSASGSERGGDSDGSRGRRSRSARRRRKKKSSKRRARVVLGELGRLARAAPPGASASGAIATATATATATAIATATTTVRATATARRRAARGAAAIAARVARREWRGAAARVGLRRGAGGPPPPARGGGRPPPGGGAGKGACTSSSSACSGTGKDSAMRWPSTRALRRQDEGEGGQGLRHQATPYQRFAALIKESRTARSSNRGAARTTSKSRRTVPRVLAGRAAREQEERRGRRRRRGRGRGGRRDDADDDAVEIGSDAGGGGADGAAAATTPRRGGARPAPKSQDGDDGDLGVDYEEDDDAKPLPRRPAARSTSAGSIAA